MLICHVIKYAAVIGFDLLRSRMAFRDVRAKCALINSACVGVNAALN